MNADDTTEPKTPTERERLAQGVALLEGLAQRAGLIRATETLELTTGSPSYGIPWSISIRGTGERPDFIPNSGYLGMTKREALATLTVVRYAIASAMSPRHFAEGVSGRAL